MAGAPLPAHAVGRRAPALHRPPRRVLPLRMCIPASSSGPSFPGLQPSGGNNPRPPGPRGEGAAGEPQRVGARPRGPRAARGAAVPLIGRSPADPAGPQAPPAARAEGRPGGVLRPQAPGSAWDAGARGGGVYGCLAPVLNGRRPRVAAGGQCACVTSVLGPRGGSGAVGKEHACATCALSFRGGGCRGKTGAPVRGWL